VKHLIDKILLGRFRQSNKQSSKVVYDIIGDSADEPRVPHFLNSIIRVSITRIHADKDQVRKYFDQSKLEELSESIKKNGVIQPILIRPHPTYVDEERGVQHYQLIAGERRWRAAKLADIETMPCIVLDLDEDQIFQISLIENIQREQLNAIEEAKAYLSLSEKYGHSYDEIATSVGKSRSHIANTIRLLKLPDRVQSELVDGKLSRGHARAIIGVENPAELVTEITEKKLNVRQVEQRVKFEKRKEQPVKKAKPVINDWRGDIGEYQDAFKNSTKSQTDLRKNAKGGLTLKVFFHSQEEVEAYLKQLKSDSDFESLRVLKPESFQQNFNITHSQSAVVAQPLAKNNLTHEAPNELSSKETELPDPPSNDTSPQETNLKDFPPNWPNRH